MKKGYTTWLSIPYEYPQLYQDDKKLIKMVGYFFKVYHEGWKPVQIVGNKAKAKWEG